MKQQNRSATFQPGEPLDHQMAVNKVQNFLRDNFKQENRFVFTDIDVDYSPDIISQLPKIRRHDGHTFDLGIFDKIVNMDYKFNDNIPQLIPRAYIEINGNVGYDYYDGAGRVVHANPTKHNKALQKRNDKINKNYCENMDIKYITLLKEEINGDIKDKDQEKNTIQYMQRELLEFIK